MQEVQDSMDDILSPTDLSNDEKAKRYFHLQDRYLSFKQQREFYYSINGIKRFIFQENFTFSSKQSLTQSDSY